MKVRCAMEKRELTYEEMFRVGKLLSIDLDETRVTKRAARKAAKAQAKKERKANEAKQTQKPKSQWWTEPHIWEKMSKAAQDAHKAKFKAWK